MIDHYIYCRFNNETQYCPVAGNFGHLDDKKKCYCSTHKIPDMINLRSYCSVNDDGIFCKTTGNYVVGEKKYCRKHANEQKNSQKEQNNEIVIEINTNSNFNNSSCASTTYSSKKLVNYSDTETESDYENFSRASTTRFSKKKRIIDDTDSDDELICNDETKSHKQNELEIFFDKISSDEYIELIICYMNSISKQNNIMMLYKIYRKLNTEKVKNKVINSLIEFISDKIDELEKQKSLKRKRT